MEAPSRILLLVITNLPQNYPLSNQTIYEMCKDFGVVLKILIFERGKSNKVFVEFATIDQAMAARSRLNYTALPHSQARIQIHFSKLRKLNLDVVSQTRGSDYHQISKDDLSTDKKPVRHDLITHSKTDDPHLLSLSRLSLGDFSLKDLDFDEDQNEEIQSPDHEMAQSVERFLDEDYQQEVSRQGSFTPMKNLGNLQWSKVTPVRNQEIDSLLDDDEQKTSETRKSSQEQMEISYLLIQQPCQTICVLGLEHPSLNCQMIWNLFSNFGNITKVSFDSRSGRAFIEYQQVEYAIIAKEILLNLSYFGTQLRITYQDKHDTSSMDTMLVPSYNYRFQVGRPLSINFPSNTLHVSNIGLSPLYQVRVPFEKIGKVENMKLLRVESDKQSLLIQMSSLEEALMAVSRLHNTEFQKKKMQISFTQSKI